MNPSIPDNYLDFSLCRAFDATLSLVQKLNTVIDKFIENIKQIEREVTTLDVKIINVKNNFQAAITQEKVSIPGMHSTADIDLLQSGILQQCISNKEKNNKDIFTDIVKPALDGISVVLDLAGDDGQEFAGNTKKVSKFIKGFNVATDILSAEGGDIIGTTLIEAGEIYKPLLIAAAAYKEGKWLWDNEDWFRGGVAGSWNALKQIGVTGFDAIANTVETLFNGGGYHQTIQDFNKISSRFSEGYADGVNLKPENKKDDRNNETQILNILQEHEALKTFQMKPEQADYYIQNGAKITRSDRWQNKYNPYQDITDQFGMDALEPIFPLFNGIADNVGHKYPINAQEQEKRPVKHDNFFEKANYMIAVFQEAGKKEGMLGLEEMIEEKEKLAKTFDGIYHTNTLKTVEASARFVRNGILNMANDNSDQEMIRPVGKGLMIPNKQSQGAVSRQITINLNKPMIENFIINVKEVKEGLNDFKHKVEGVLLEILNSANVIQ